MNIDRSKALEDQQYCQVLDEGNVQKIARTGGTFLHTSRTKPSKVSKKNVPEFLQRNYREEVNDLTSEILKNLEYLGIEYLVPIGGDCRIIYFVLSNFVNSKLLKNLCRFSSSQIHCSRGNTR